METTDPREIIDEKYKEFDVLREGTSNVLFPKGGEVFYNPAQEVNRDLSVLAIRAYQELLASEKTQPSAWQTFLFFLLLFPSLHFSLYFYLCAFFFPFFLFYFLADLAKKLERKEKYDGLTILEALSATGLRSIRYFKEIPNVKKIVCNDIDPKAVETIRRNIEYNKIDVTKVVPNEADAT
jgi:tRNA (guanine26-N2/guanine27-N2)-dimethyltransferase